MFRTTLLVYNPTAGLKVMPNNLHSIILLLEQSNYLVTCYATQQKLDAKKIISSIGSHYDLVICAGGDGSLHEAINALAPMESPPLFGYIPCGTTNDFANTAGLPTSVLQATQVICQGKSIGLDVGCFNQEYFAYIAAFGLFTDVSYDTAQGLKNVLGHVAYLFEGIKRLANIRTWHCKINCDDTLLEGDYHLGLVTNSSSVGGFSIVNKSDDDFEPHFRLILLKQIPSAFEVQGAISALLGKSESPYLLSMPFQHLTIECEEPLKWTLDGEYGGCYEHSYLSVFSDSIQLIVP